VGVLGPETVLADADVSGVQVDVFPEEPERFPLAEFLVCDSGLPAEAQPRFALAESPD
jgi:hypothetical protein